MKRKRKHISLGCSDFDLCERDGTTYSKIRVPRLKASKAHWKRFYKKFPWLEGKIFVIKTGRVYKGEYNRNLTRKNRSKLIKLKRI